uniref:Glycoside hydrolase family 125 protein n=1 Tax=Mycena chlorophos TaxID=658473 RepID=A0ABQ0L509_MYCCL|nr:predicted protein [Mycena chlorophos]
MLPRGIVASLLLFLSVMDTAPLGATACMSFAQYSKRPQGNSSTGPLALPYMRPDVGCRTFNSSAVETLIDHLVGRMKDPDLARLFQNTYPNTLDTTIKWFNPDLTFVVTGDIPAEWLRDSSNQFKNYLPLLAYDEHLRELTRGVINLQARYITQYPYCNAFQPPPESGLPPQGGSGDTGAHISPPDDLKIVWTCGYELDSLLSFIQLSRLYYDYSGDTTVFTYDDGKWFKAMTSYELDSLLSFLQLSRLYYDYSGDTTVFTYDDGKWFKAMTSVLKAAAAGTKRRTTSQRRQDGAEGDAEQEPPPPDLATLLERHSGLRQIALTRSKTVEDALWEYGTVPTKKWGEVFAYEVDGYGGAAIQDDANVPSLISLPYLGFVNTTSDIYQNTRKMLLSPTGSGNPYYAHGPAIRGVSSPHIDEAHVWPMGIVSEVITGTDDQEILDALEWLKNSTTGLGLIHESVHSHNVYDYTRPWFAWANSYFGEALVYIAETRPHLLFDDGAGFSVKGLFEPELSTDDDLEMGISAGGWREWWDGWWLGFSHLVAGINTPDLNEAFPIHQVPLNFDMATTFIVYCDAASASDASATGVQVDIPVVAQAKQRPVIATYTAKENINPRTGRRCLALEGHKADGVKRRAPSNATVAPRPAVPVVLASKTVPAENISINAKRPKLDSNSGVKHRDGLGGRRVAAGGKHNKSKLPRLSEEFVPSSDIAGAYEKAFGLEQEVDLAGLFSAVSLNGTTSEAQNNVSKSTRSNPNVRDYVFGDNLSRSVGSSSKSSTPRIFTTPEREQIYSAFTFKTPSPIASKDGYASLQVSPTKALALKAGQRAEAEVLRFRF